MFFQRIISNTIERNRRFVEQLKQHASCNGSNEMAAHPDAQFIKNETRTGIVAYSLFLVTAGNGYRNI